MQKLLSARKLTKVDDSHPRSVLQNLPTKKNPKSDSSRKLLSQHSSAANCKRFSLCYWQNMKQLRQSKTSTSMGSKMALSNDVSLQRKICKALEIPIKLERKEAQSISKQKKKNSKRKNGSPRSLLCCGCWRTQKQLKPKTKKLKGKQNSKEKKKDLPKLKGCTACCQQLSSNQISVFRP